MKRWKLNKRRWEIKKNNFWYRVFSDTCGIPSVMRVLSAYVCVVIIGVWAVLCLLSRELLPIGYDNVALVAFTLGAKAYQRREEKGVECEKK